MMNHSIDDQSLRAVIQGLADGFRKNAEVEHGPEVARWMEKYGKDLLDPEHFSLFYSHSKEEERDVLIQAVFHILKTKEPDAELGPKVEAVYGSYSFFENHITRLVEEYEGHMCSADKGGYLLTSYLKWLKYKTPLVLETRHPYWVPRFGSPHAWIAFIDSCHGLLYGVAEPYICAYRALVNEIKTDREEHLGFTEAHCTQHAYFQQSVPSEKGTRYQFVGPDEIRVTIAVSPQGSLGYRLTKGQEHDAPRLSSKEKPKWVKDLIDHLLSGPI